MCETPSILRSSSAAVVASVLRIGLAIFSLPVLLGFCSVDNRSNLYVRHSVYSYPEACHRTSFSDFHSLSVLPRSLSGKHPIREYGHEDGEQVWW